MHILTQTKLLNHLRWALILLVSIQLFGESSQPSIINGLITRVYCEQTGAESSQPIDGSSSSSSSGTSFLSSLLSPFRETLRQAKRLLSHHSHHQLDTIVEGNLMDNVESLVHDGFDQLQAQTFKLFMRMYNKTYSPSELPKRMALFFERRKNIEDSIRAFSEGRLPFMMRENTYLDWDEQELKALTGVSPPRDLHELTPEERAARSGASDNVGDYHNESSLTRDSNPIRETNEFDTITLDIDDDDDDDTSNNNNDAKLISSSSGPMKVLAPVSIPAQKDWRQSGCVAAPVNQEKCGCCYAIATMNVVEAMRCINEVSSPILSPQQIIDCSTPRAGYQNHGCDGGWPTRVLKYLQDVGVASRETCYPLVKRQERCKLAKVKQVQGCTVSSSVSSSSPRLRYKVLNNERDILYHVATTGPVITVMRATDKFLYYGSGIFDDPKCTRRANDVDHAISIVGYGRENGLDYWLIKNSWGDDWGIEGYGKYRRGKNACSIGHWGWVVLK